MERLLCARQGFKKAFPKLILHNPESLRGRSRLLARFTDEETETRRSHSTYWKPKSSSVTEARFKSGHLSPAKLLTTLLPRNREATESQTSDLPCSRGRDKQG